MFFSGLGESFVDVMLSLIALIMAMFVAIPFHEYAHAFVAKKEGDFTATIQKRCTPAALAHFDFSGFLMMLLFGFGWAKPVPIDQRNFKRGKKSLFLVSIAGVVMNLILGALFLFIFMLIYKIDANFYSGTMYGYLLYKFLNYSFLLNFGLAIFNLLPLYPFDGYNVIDSLSKRENSFLIFVRKYSFVIFILIILTGIYDLYYSAVISNIINGLVDLFGKILGL